MFNFLMFSHQFTKENSPHQFTNCNWSGVFMRKSAFKNIYLFTFILVIYKKHTSCHSKYLFMMKSLINLMTSFFVSKLEDLLVGLSFEIQIN